MLKGSIVQGASRGVGIFLLLSFGLAWAIWLVAFFVLDIDPNAPSFQLIGALPGFAPAIAAIIVRLFVERSGFGDSGLRPRFSKSWRYYLIAWLLPLVVGPVIILLVTMLGVSKPDFTLKRAFAQPDLGGGEPPVLLTQLPNFLKQLPLMFSCLISTFILFGEELGWRGYLQMRLFPERRLLSYIVTGFIWGIWHIPLIIVGYTFGPDVSIWAGLIAYPITATLISIIIGWLHDKSGSVWVSSLAHAANNGFGGTWMAILFFGGPNWLFSAYGGLMGWLPFGAIALLLILLGKIPQRIEPAS